MAKRFTCTEKWKKQFMRGLNPSYKLLWVYILDECNASGIWEVDMDVAQIKMGVKITQKEAEKLFKEKIIIFDNNTKWFVPSFIEFQYGTLSENNRAHTKVISELKKFNLIEENFLVKKVAKAPCDAPKQAPYQGAKDMVEDKDKEMVEEMDMEQDKEKGGEVQEILMMPFSSEKFMRFWVHWKKYKERQFKFKYTSVQSEQAALNKLSNLSSGSEEKAIAIMTESMAQGWKGFFELKNTQNENTTASNRGGYNPSQYDDMERELEAIINRV